MLLGMLAIAGLILRDPQRLNQLADALSSVAPSQAAATLRDLLTTTREDAGAASVISVALLLFSGSNFLANMQMVFNLAYHVQDRNFILQRVVALIMLLIATALLLVSTTAYGLGNTVGALPVAVPVLGRAVGWSVSILSARSCCSCCCTGSCPTSPGPAAGAAGRAAATGLFFLILQVFPLYLALFGKGFQAYAAFACSCGDVLGLPAGDRAGAAGRIERVL